MVLWEGNLQISHIWVCFEGYLKLAWTTLALERYILWKITPRLLFLEKWFLSKPSVSTWNNFKQTYWGGAHRENVDSNALLTQKTVCDNLLWFLIFQFVLYILLYQNINRDPVNSQSQVSEYGEVRDFKK